MSANDNPDKTSPGEEPQKKPPATRFIKFVLLALTLPVLLIAAAGVTVEYYFPREKARTLAQKQLTQLLKIPVSIGSVDFSLLRGIQIQQLALGGGESILRIQSLTLDYDLTQLAQGHFIINELGIHQPEVNLVSRDGMWNFQPILDQVLLGQAQEPQAAPPTKTPADSTLPIPVAIDLKQLLVSDIKFQLDMDETVLARLEGLTLKAKGHIGAAGIDVALEIKMRPTESVPDGHNISLKSSEHDLQFATRLLMDLTVSTKDLNRVQASGSIRLKNNSLKFGRNFPAPDIGVDLQTVALLKQQSLNVEQLALDIASHNRIVLSGEAHDYLSDPAFKILVQSASFDIGELLEIATLPSLQAKGSFTINNLAVTGNLANKENIEVTGGNLILDNFSADYPDLKASLGETRAAITLGAIKLENRLPQTAAVSVDLKIGRARFADLSIENFKQKLQFTMPGPEQNDLRFTAAADVVGFTHPEMGKLETGFNLQGNAAGNFLKGDLRSFDFDFKENQLVTLRLTGNAQDFGRKHFSVTPVVELTLDKVSDFLPPELRKKIGLEQLSGGVSISARMEGSLDKGFQPLTAKAQSAVALKNLNAQLNAFPLTVKDLNLQTDFAGRFDSKKGVEIPAINITAGFQSIGAMGTYAIGPTQSHSTITVAGPIPLAGKLEKIPLAYQLQLKATQIQSSEPAFVAEKLALKSNLSADFSLPGDVRNLTLEGEVSLDQVEGLGMLTVGKLQTNLTASVKDTSLEQTETALKVRVLAPRFTSGDLDISLEEVQLDVVSHQNLQSGDVDIQSAQLTLPSVLVLQTGGHLENWGKTFSLKSEMSEANLAELWKHLPEATRQQIEGLQGTATFALSAHGKLPGKEDFKHFTLPVEIVGDLTLNNVSATLPDQELNLQNINTAGHVHYKKDQVELTAKIGLGQLQMEDMQAAGSATVTLNLQGEIPDAAGLKKLDLPAGFQARGQLALEHASLSMPSLQLDLQDINYSTQMDVRETSASLSGELAIQKLFKRDVMGKEEWLDPKFVFNYALEDWDKFSIDTHHLTVASRGGEMSSTGRVEHLKPFLTGKLPLTPADLTRYLDVALDTRVRVQTGRAIPVTPSFTTSGSVNSRVTLKLNAGKSLALDGEVGFKKFNATVGPSLKVNAINGKFLFNKKLLLDKKQLDTLSHSVLTSQRGYFGQLREFSPYKNILRIGSLQFDEQKAERINLDLLYEGNQLRVEKFLLDVLSGSVAGNLFLRQTAGGPRLDFFIEFTSMDAGKLTGQPLSDAASETQIDGNMKVGFQVIQGTGNKTVGLDQIDLKLDITRIGDEALDRLLLFLDPQESQPAFAATRDMLKLASPHKVLLTLGNGNLSLDIWLKNKLLGNIIQAPGLKRLAVGNLKHFQQISGQLQKLSALENILQYLAAQGITFDEEQGMTLF